MSKRSFEDDFEFLAPQPEGHMSRDWSEEFALAGYNRPDRRLLNEAHAEQRALERYDTELSESDTAGMTKQVQENRGLFLYRKSKRLSVWLVYWPTAAMIVPVFYDRKRQQVASVLPRTAAYRPDCAVAKEAE